MRRALWKGAISFGLINIPVELYTAEKHDELDFTLLDKRDLSPVGYKRYNKKSGREVPWENIIKGYEYEDGKFVLMSDEDLRRANVEATQSIDIQSFVEREQVPILYYEQPYFLAPAKGATRPMRCCARPCWPATRWPLPRSSSAPVSTWPPSFRRATCCN
ncbi:Ku protein [Herbaspirillum frisingense]|uniref:Ku protein n=1 Tax=Herbaspirillum frisingense TaxID=92645 RepID=UPI0030B83536